MVGLWTAWVRVEKFRMMLRSRPRIESEEGRAGHNLPRIRSGAPRPLPKRLRPPGVGLYSPIPLRKAPLRRRKNCDTPGSARFRTASHATRILRADTQVANGGRL